MTKRNPNLAKLISGYLFPEIHKRKVAFMEQNPGAKVISLGIGDTTEPIPVSIARGLSEAAQRLGTPEGYQGYGPEKGGTRLREMIASTVYKGLVHPDAVFVSDGSKCDIGRLQVLFGPDATVALQDPTYPAYVDSAVVSGKTGQYDYSRSQYSQVVYMPCLPENDFFPALNNTPRTDIIFYCSPNNPTGAVTSRENLEALVKFAKKNHSIIIYDAAYAHFIHDQSLPKSIYEIEGAKEVAIELGSFSKMAGFTGVRLGWSIVPEELKFDDGSTVNRDWHRIHHTFFNGASNIAQAGGLAALQPQGWQEVLAQTRFYLENAHLLRQVFAERGIEVHGGEHAPYLWARFPGQSSWEVFEDLLDKAHLVSTPGAGFGPAGESFLRFSAFGHRATILEAADRLREYLR
jgi:LL-diaminopimelate aminotransferase